MTITRNDVWALAVLLLVLVTAVVVFGSLGLFPAVPASLAVLAVYRLAETRGQSPTWDVLVARIAYGIALVIAVTLSVVFVRVLLSEFWKS